MFTSTGFYNVKPNLKKRVLLRPNAEAFEKKQKLDSLFQLTVYQKGTKQLLKKILPLCVNLNRYAVCSTACLKIKKKHLRKFIVKLKFINK